MLKYSPPEYKSDGFNCPYCDVYAYQRWEKTYWESGQNITSIRIKDMDVEVSNCSRCANSTLWLNQKIIYPATRMAPPANNDLPDNVKEVYEEAAAIAGLSTRAACALLRVAIEMFLKDLGHLKENGNINDSIGNLVKIGLDERMQRALDVVRVTGNNAVHPGKIDFDDSTDVSSLFELANFIADALITRPKQINEMFDNLPEEAKEGIGKRDGKA